MKQLDAQLRLAPCFDRRRNGIRRTQVTQRRLHGEVGAGITLDVDQPTKEHPPRWMLQREPVIADDDLLTGVHVLADGIAGSLTPRLLNDPQVVRRDEVGRARRPERAR